MEYIIVYSDDYVEVIQENRFSSRDDAEFALLNYMPYMDMTDIEIIAVE